MNKSTSYKQRCFNLQAPVDKIDATPIARLGGTYYTWSKHLSLLNVEKFGLIHALMWQDYPCGRTLVFLSLYMDRHGLNPEVWRATTVPPRFVPTPL